MKSVLEVIFCFDIKLISDLSFIAARVQIIVFVLTFFVCFNLHFCLSDDFNENSFAFLLLLCQSVYSFCFWFISLSLHLPERLLLIHCIEFVFYSHSYLWLFSLLPTVTDVLMLSWVKVFSNRLFLGGCAPPRIGKHSLNQSRLKQLTCARVKKPSFNFRNERFSNLIF